MPVGVKQNGFSTHFEPYGIIFDDLHDFDDFAIMSSRLMLFQEGARTLGECPEGPGIL